jgi:hypothetical protein
MIFFIFIFIFIFIFSLLKLLLLGGTIKRRPLCPPSRPLCPVKRGHARYDPFFFHPCTITSRAETGGLVGRRRRPLSRPAGLHSFHFSAVNIFPLAINSHPTRTKAQSKPAKVPNPQTPLYLSSTATASETIAQFFIASPILPVATQYAAAAAAGSAALASLSSLQEASLLPASWLGNWFYFLLFLPVSCSVWPGSVALFLDFKVPESFLFASKFGRGIPKFGLFVSMI